MNLKAKEEKKGYVAPKMSVLDMGSNAVFLSCSGDGCGVNEDEGYDDEFGFNLNDGMNHHA